MFYVILIILGLILLFFIYNKFKLPKLCAINLFTGGVKTGKSAVSLTFAIKTYKRHLFKWKVHCFFTNLLNKTFFRKKPLEFREEPLFYSNIPVANIKFTLLTTEHLLRKVRLNYKSVVFIDEASLVADSMLIKDTTVNNQLLLFFKLFGHETKGGCCIINTHCVSDLHYAIKRAISQYFYIHSLTKLPFISICRLRECIYSDDGTTVNAFTEDIEEKTKTVLIFNRIFKYYDCYCYSVFTDKLHLKNSIKKLKNDDGLKCYKISSFRQAFNDLFVCDSGEVMQNKEKTVNITVEDFIKSLEVKK